MSMTPEQLAKQVPPSDSVQIELARLRLAETICRSFNTFPTARVSEMFHRLVRAAEKPSTEINHA